MTLREYKSMTDRATVERAEERAEAERRLYEYNPDILNVLSGREDLANPPSRQFRM